MFDTFPDRFATLSVRDVCKLLPLEYRREIGRKPGKLGFGLDVLLGENLDEVVWNYVSRRIGH